MSSVVIIRLASQLEDKLRGCADRRRTPILLADLPGVRPADVDVRFENGELTIHGRRTPSHAGKKRVLWEYEPTHYHRAFRLAEVVSGDRIEAELKNGVLTVRLPKAEAAKPRRIAVKGE